MASKNILPHAYLVEHFRCKLYSVVQYFSLAYLRTIKGRVKVLCLILSCIAKLEYFSCPNYMLHTYQWRFKSHGDFPKF